MNRDCVDTKKLLKRCFFDGRGKCGGIGFLCTYTTSPAAPFEVLQDLSVRICSFSTR